MKSEEGDSKEEPSLSSVIGDFGGERQTIGGNYSPGVNPDQQQVSGRETVKE